MDEKADQADDKTFNLLRMPKTEKSKSLSDHRQGSSKDSKHTSNWLIKLHMYKRILIKKPALGKKFGTSHLCTATVLSYLGRQEEVCGLMQQVSHSTRTFIIQQDGLPGFLCKNHNNIRSWMYELEKTNFSKYL